MANIALGFEFGLVIGILLAVLLIKITGPKY